MITLKQIKQADDLTSYEVALIEMVEEARELAERYCDKLNAAVGPITDTATGEKFVFLSVPWREEDDPARNQ